MKEKKKDGALRLKATARRRAFNGFLIGIIGFLAGELAIRGQGTLTVAFDLPPFLVPGQGDGGPEYVESGIRFKPLFSGSAISQNVVRFRGPYVDFPDDGSTYFGGTDSTNILTFGRTDGEVFGLVSVELADYSVHFPGPGTVEFIGYRQDGSVVTTGFSLGPLIVDGRTAFETFYFGPQFTDLERVEVPSHYYWMDNLVVAIPEPGAGALLLLGAALGRRRFRFRI